MTGGSRDDVTFTIVLTRVCPRVLDFTEWGAVDALDETGYSIRLGIWTLPSQVLECSCLGAVTLRVLINGYDSLFVGAATP